MYEKIIIWGLLTWQCSGEDDSCDGVVANGALVDELKERPEHGVLGDGLQHAAGPDQAAQAGAEGRHLEKNCEKNDISNLNF